MDISPAVVGIIPAEVNGPALSALELAMRRDAPPEDLFLQIDQVLNVAQDLERRLVASFGPASRRTAFTDNDAWHIAVGWQAAQELVALDFGASETGLQAVLYVLTGSRIILPPGPSDRAIAQWSAAIDIYDSYRDEREPAFMMPFCTHYHHSGTHDVTSLCIGGDAFRSVPRSMGIDGVAPAERMEFGVHIASLVAWHIDNCLSNGRPSR